MTLTQTHIDTLKSAPFVIAPVANIPHDLCRKGLLVWSEGAWRLTEAGQAFLAGLAVQSTVDAA
ncbi:MAG: hypothetical protein NVV74_20900 [Magnetospirillum sp.]|nr:hypothetical protein [Magnetospirillum sp.]